MPHENAWTTWPFTVSDQDLLWSSMYSTVTNDYFSYCVTLVYRKLSVKWWSAKHLEISIVHDIHILADHSISYNMVVAQWRLWSACASAQADQSLCCPTEDTLDLWFSKECPAKVLLRLNAQSDLSRRWVPMQFYRKCCVPSDMWDLPGASFWLDRPSLLNNDVFWSSRPSEAWFSSFPPDAWFSPLPPPEPCFSTFPPLDACFSPFSPSRLLFCSFWVLALWETRVITSCSISLLLTKVALKEPSSPGCCADPEGLTSYSVFGSSEAIDILLTVNTSKINVLGTDHVIITFLSSATEMELKYLYILYI